MLSPIIYAAFISLGLPDSVLGSAWPTIYPEFGVPVSYAGIVSAIISVGTVISSLLSARLISVLKTGGVTAISVAMTAAALYGFSICHNFWALCLWAVPYGLGAGSVDAALNNYVAIHYKSHHMSWLHCMWGVGATLGPYIMGHVLAQGLPWNMGYRMLSFFQMALVLALVIALPLWKAADDEREEGKEEEESAPDEPWKPRPLKEVIRIPGVKEIMVAFFCYCGLESTTGLWTGSYLTLHTGLSAEAAATFTSLAFLGITIGRALNGFLAFKFTDDQLISCSSASAARRSTPASSIRPRPTSGNGSPRRSSGSRWPVLTWARPSCRRSSGSSPSTSPSASGRPTCWVCWSSCSSCTSR